jgi:protoporphyrinogen oxidase
MHSKKLCVIGGGIAGLAFTYRLEQLNPLIEITLFEKKNRVGGRLMTTRN